MRPTPPQDRAVSPYTGWTRAHWESIVDTTLAAVRRYASPGNALVALPGPVSVSGARSDGLEGFARTFLAAGFRLAHAHEGAGALAQWYADGLAAGTDPSSPDAWPRIDDVPQSKVEAASIAIALHESRAVLWDALDDRVRDRVVDWFAEVVGRTDYPPCNWLWFQNVVEAFLRSVGGPWSAEDIERNVAATESWYRSDGWYTDGLDRGTGRKFDWYAGWAMNFYPLWYCRMSADRVDGPTWTLYRERLRAYLAGAQHLFAPDGAPMHQGRSLTYRHAALAPVWAGAVFDASPLPPGRTRRLASGVLRHFAGAGAWDADGLQPIGWYGAFPTMRQPYSGAGSPYWSSKAFAGLVLPADHPVWTDVEEPLEVETRDVAVTLAVPGWVVSSTRVDGVVRMVNHGTDHGADDHFGVDDPGYARHGYATHAGPDYDPGAWESPVDGHVALVDADGAASHRRPLVPLGVRGRVGVSRHRAHWLVGGLPRAVTWPPAESSFRPGPWLTTASVLRGAVEIRLARVDLDSSSPDAGPWTLRIGGYALAGADPPAVEVVGARASVVRDDGLTSTVVGLTGAGLGRLPEPAVIERAGVNAYGRCSAVPVLSSGAAVEPGRVYAAAVVLGASGAADRASGPDRTSGAAAAELPEVTATGAEVTVRWPDGETDRVRLSP
jgi:hypothetical protein